MGAGMTTIQILLYGITIGLLIALRLTRAMTVAS
jgi:hypothetical protein